MTVNARNQAAKYRPTLVGDRGMPWCQRCDQAPTYGTDHDGRLVEHCRCGSQLVATIGCYAPPPEPGPAKHHPHTQSRNHPWKRGLTANVPWRRGHAPPPRRDP